MDKNAIKKYAVWARRELISRVSKKAEQFGVTEENIVDANADTVGGHLLTTDEKNQRRALISRIEKLGYKQTMEEAAYTWFNRFTALRFMEVNGYLPTHVRVFTDEQNAFKPQILAEAIHLEMDGLDMEKVYALKEENKTEELYKYLLITQCNALREALPGMFTDIEGYTELLFPDNLLREGSAIEQMITLVPEDDWKDAVQIIGWLYQYYNAEPKDEVFANLKKNIKISKENIPAATQLFTPDWIVRYMVENSLGRLWVEGHPNEELKASWKYYLEEAEQEPEVRSQLAEIRKEYAELRPEDIKVIDPCMGSGHILVYMFDVLIQIYEAYGYNAREAAGLILQNNLYGLDIDDRAAQLAYFAVMMKARQYDRRIFSRGIRPHVYSIVESNDIDREALKLFYTDESTAKVCIREAERVLDVFTDAKEYGSILSVEGIDVLMLRDFAEDPLENDEMAFSLDTMHASENYARYMSLLEVAIAMKQKYHAVVTNPPYMGASGMGGKLSDYVKKKYPDSKSDLFAVFIERCGAMTSKNGYQAMITQHAWMFLSSFEKLREKLLKTDTVNMAHLGARAFDEIGGEVVQTTSFVMRKSSVEEYKGTYCRLIDPTSQQGKENMFLAKENRYTSLQNNFSKIPGSPVAYWVSSRLFSLFENEKHLHEVANPRKGLVTLDNARFIRCWHEVSFYKIGFGVKSGSECINKSCKWIPINKGGEFRKWYGNNDYVVNWEQNGKEIKENIVRVYKGGSYTKEVRSEDKYFLPGITWTVISSGITSFRRYYDGFIFSNSGESVTSTRGTKFDDYCLGLLNSKYGTAVLNLLSPTMGFESGYIGMIPIIEDDQHIELVEQKIQNCISLSRSDWDSFETSWDFKKHPLVELRFAGAYAWGDNPPTMHIEYAYNAWKLLCEERFNQLKANEEEINRIFIDIYGLQDELTPEVEDKDVTVRKADLERDIKSLISYAVGCMFGRYSLDVEGLVLAGYSKVVHTTRSYEFDDEELEKFATINPDGSKSFGTRYHWVNQEKYQSFPIVVDNIIPICDDEYFDDDIVGRFIEFVRVVYGDDTLEENLEFIADALGGKGSPREVIRNYFINGFYADHLKTYQKRPIYWLFDSGKKNGFKALIYMHRYKPDTVARMRTDYVHEQQSRYRTAIEDLENRINGASTSERVKLTKQLQKLQDQAEELRVYEEKIHHLADMMLPIDLDDGVKVNYAKFADVLAKIK